MYKLSKDKNRSGGAIGSIASNLFVINYYLFVFVCDTIFEK